MKRLSALAVLLVPLLAVTGCGIFKTDQQLRAERAREKPLEMPPDLTAPTADQRFALPDPKASTSYSQFSRDRSGAPQGTPAAFTGVLQPVANARIERRGDQRWIVAKAEPGQVWPIVREFWLDLGFSIARETPQSGIMETNWYESRANVETTGLRGLLGRALPGMYSTGERDRFRTRLEPGLEPGTTEIYVSHRGLEEVLTTGQDSSRWQPRGSGTDRDLEAEMLGRMLVKLGEPTQRAATAPAPATEGKPWAAGAAVAAATVVPPNAILQNNGAGPLVVNDSFDRAWRRVGLALDRTGFTVVDRDRSKGQFFVRYIDPETQAADSGAKGWLEGLAFWRAPPKASTEPQYRIQVADAGSGQSQVTVQNAKGEPETSPTGRRILALLLDQLK